MGPSRRETHFVWGLQRQKGFDRVWFTDEVDRGPELTLLASSIALSLSLSFSCRPGSDVGRTPAHNKRK